MKVGLIVPWDLDGRSGGTLYDAQLASFLRRAGVEVSLFPLTTYRKAAILRAAKTLDAIIEDEIGYRTLVSLNHDLHKASKPILAVVHNLQWLLATSSLAQARCRVGERQFLQTVDGAVFVSASVRRAVERLLNRPVPGVVACPGKDHFQPKRQVCPAPPPLRVLAVGAIGPAKGLDILLDALGLLPSRSWTLSVVGAPVDAAYLATIHSRIRREGMSAQVSLHGFLDCQFMGDMYASHHVFAAPSRFEGYGIAAVEALGAGLPVLGSKNGGMADIVVHGSNGYLFSPRQPHELAGWLRRLQQQPELLESLSAHAHETFQGLPSWDDSLQGVHRYLESLLP